MVWESVQTVNLMGVICREMRGFKLWLGSARITEKEYSQWSESRFRRNLNPTAATAELNPACLGTAQ